MSYNLLEEKWIPVLWRCGKPDKVGIREALTQAGEIHEICAASPLDTCAIYRFLLAFLQWCKPIPTEGEVAAVLQGSGFPAKSFSQDALLKLGGSEDRFELLGEDYGFYQDVGAPKELLQEKQQRWDRDEAKKKEQGKKAGPPEKRPTTLVDEDYRPATDLLQDLPSGTNVAHFRHMRDFREGLCPGCCAVGMIRLSAFATATKHGKDAQKPSSINGNTPLYAVPSGSCLSQTILFNWPIAGTQEGRPGWLIEGKPKPEDRGTLAYLTWRPRQIWLSRPNTETQGGVCSYCGEIARLVRRIIFRPGWERPFWKEKWREDPHLLTRLEQAKTARIKPKMIAVSLPDPSRPLDDHARIWRVAYRAILEAATRATDGNSTEHCHLSRSMRKCQSNGDLNVTCFGPRASKELYKDAEALEWRLPVAGLGAKSAQEALREISRLDDITPRSVLRAALPRTANGRPEVASALAVLAVETECLLRERFERFVEDLAGNKEKAVDNWRSDAQKLVGNQLQRGCALVATGSVLRRREKADLTTLEFKKALDKRAEAEKGAAEKDKQPAQTPQMEAR